jgi:Flp pilus assembly protein TadG
MASLRKLISRFRKSQSGNVALLFGLALIPMVTASGVAIDYSSASNGRQIAQSEADAAALEVARAAVKIQTDPANSKLSQGARQALVDTKASAILASRKALAQDKLGSRVASGMTLTGSWVNSLKTEYAVEASLDHKNYFPSFVKSSTTRVSVSATSKMEVDTVTQAVVPTIDNPGYEAGDYNRIYAYCYDHSKRTNADKGRTQMTAVSSNGTDGSKSEMDDNEVFKNVQMPICKQGETLSWRLYNVRGQRTTKNSWPKDKKVSGSSPQAWTQEDKSGVEIYNHFSDTQYHATTGAEQYAFTGAAFGFNQPIAMMETVICDTKDECTPGKPGSKTPSGKDRNPSQSPLACSPGKFMYIGWEDRPFLPINAGNNDYSTGNSHQWTDSDYDDIRLVISCPEQKIVNYKTKISLIK